MPSGAISLTQFFVLGVFSASGFAALIYQIVWQRMLTLFGGADVYSVTIIVAAFMGGLGFGNLAGGHLADRFDVRSRLFAFAACETAVAVFAVFSDKIYYDLLYVGFGEWAPSSAVMAAVIFAVTLWPTFFMGMSLPLLATALTTDARNPAHWVPVLYGANTLGAAVGSLFAVDVLFGSFDLVTSVRLGAVLSLSCAISALLAARLVRRNHPDTHIETEQPATSAATLNPRSPFGLATWITVYALSGFIALSLEIVWFRLLGVILKSRSDTFGHLLAGYLGGVGLGALVANHRRVRSGRPEPAFFLLQSAIPLVAAASVVFFVVMIDRVPWLNPLWQYLGEYEPAGRRGRFLALYLGIPAVLMILPTLMMGLSFGHLQHAVQTDLKTLGRRVGWLQTANIAGSMIGAILTGAGLLDWFGTAGTLRLLVCCSIPFLLLYLQTDPRRIWAAAGAGLVALLLAYSIPSPTILWARLHGAAPENVIQAEDASGVSALKMSNGSDLTIVHANGLGQSSLPYGGIHTVLGALPAMTHGKPESIAVIGLGSGDTLFAIGGRSETRIIDSIEIVAPQLNTLDHLLRRRFYPGLQMILQDDRVHHWFTDGRAFIRKGPPRYDIVEADALRPTSAFAGNLFSVEYFELLRSRLKPGGLAVTWIATPRVLNTFVKVFPHVVAFEGLALGSMEPVRFDPVELQGRIQQTAIRQYYLRGGVDIVKLLTPYFSASPRTYGPEFDRTTLEDVNRDLFPKDEFSVRYMRR